MGMLTIGTIEDKLRKFNKGTLVHVGCNCCNRSSQGTENIIKIKDNTEQSFGYVEIILNDATEPEKHLSPNEEKYYKNIVYKQKEEIIELKKQLEWYRSSIERIRDSAESSIKLGKIKC